MSRVATSALRYWLALLRHEEALSVRPRARRAPHEGTLSARQMLTPVAGQDYVKLPFEGAEAFLVRGAGHLTRPVTGEAAAFFENWLAAQYRRAAEDERLEHLVFFPTVISPRQELAGLLRLPVHIEWRTQAEQRFALPTAAERARKQAPPPPASLRVIASEKDGDDPVLFVDFRLLRDTLRIDRERLDALAEALKAPSLAGAKDGGSRDAHRMLVALIELLREQVALDGDPLDGDQASTVRTSADDAELLRLLCDLVRRRLAQCGSSSRAFDVGVLVDASRNRTTFHVQRDLQVALSLFGEQALSPEHPLRTYLGRRKITGIRRPLLGRFAGLGLTASQRSAGELFLGSSFSAVQGPPGTGKTHLSLSLAADELIRKLLPLEHDAPLGLDFLLVTSTNNRAVDNVVQPLGCELPTDALPLALRVGSREVVEKVTTSELQRALRWLERRAEPSSAEWADAKRDFFEAKRRLDAHLEPSLAATEAAAELLRARRELAEIDQELAGAAPVPSVPHATRETARAGELLQPVAALAARLRALSELSEADRSSPRIVLEQHFKLTRERHIEPVEQQLGCSLGLVLPPDVPQGGSPEATREAWEEAAEVALARVLDWHETLQSWAERDATEARRVELTRRIARLERASIGRPAAPVIDWEALQPRFHELFSAARSLRECWARKQRERLVPALQRALDVCRNGRSLRTLLSSSKGPGLWLRRLYPVWGCTLLSLGNNFAPEPDSIARAIVDEAGQCHAAYAASAMLRARSILVIGDTFQLEPVVDLPASDEARIAERFSSSLPREVFERYRVYEGSENSAQSIADAVVSERPTLVDHFRCQPEIAQVCERLCDYGLVTHTPRASGRALLRELDFPLLHVPVEGEQERFSGSWVNRAELLEVCAWVERLLKAGMHPDELGVITPFRGQLELLWRTLREASVPLERAVSWEEQERGVLFAGSSGGVALGTVHRFQGGERRVIVFSSTVTQGSTLRFVDARPNLVNVAASRAREHLITVGHTPTLLAGSHTRALLQDARRLRAST